MHLLGLRVMAVGFSSILQKGASFHVSFPTVGCNPNRILLYLYFLGVKEMVTKRISGVSFTWNALRTVTVHFSIHHAFSYYAIKFAENPSHEVTN